MRRHHEDHEHQHDDQHGGPRRRGGPRFGGPGGPGGFGFGPDGPGPWAGKRMRRGDIRTAVLSGLQDGPAHGYELMTKLSERTGGRWRPSPGSMYPTLQALQDEGLVTSTEADGKRVYELTETGRAAAAERAERAESSGGSWELGGADPAQSKLRSATMQMVAAVRQVGMSDSPELHERAEAVITEARRKLYQLLAEA